MLLRTTVSWLALIGLAFLLFSCTSSPQIDRIRGNTMGTTYNISWVQPQTVIDPLVLKADLNGRLERLNQSMSTWQKRSLISRFNQHAFTTHFTIDDDFALVVQQAIELAELTDGALDITVGPLVNLWGFGPDGEIDKQPTSSQIAAVQEWIGIDKLTLNGRQLAKSHPKLQIDLSAIAKGYAVDVVAKVMEQRGIDSYLVEIGGEIRTKGIKPDGTGWRIAVEQPDPNGREIFQIIEPNTMAVATSGDYRNYFVENGRRFSHLIDPRTGEPINSRLVSATVLDPSCMRADGLATALLVMGTEQALAFAEQQQLPIMLIETTEQGFAVHYSVEFEKYLTAGQQAHQHQVVESHLGKPQT